MRESDLPHFEIRKIIKHWNKRTFVGSFSETKGVALGIAYLLLPPDAFVKGRVIELRADENSGTFAPIDRASRKFLREGQTYVYFDGYWGERAQIALERSRHWKRVSFVPSDTERRALDGKLEVVKGGWDHEHCAICWERISEDENPYGYVDQSDTWICEACYEKYVLPRSLDFMPR